MKKAFYLFKVSFEKSIIELVRYKFNTLSQILSFYLLFLAMFYGMKLFGISMEVNTVRLGQTLEGFIIGYFLWTIMVMAYSDTAYNVISDANRGTLEQISMSRLGLHNILIVRSISNLVVHLLICFIVLWSIMNTTNYWLDIKVGQVTVTVIIGIFSIIGISLVFGGLALVFKKVQSILNIVQYFLIGLVIPGGKALGPQLSSVLPFRPTIDKIYEITFRSDYIHNYFSWDYIVMVANSIIYFVVGLVVFKICCLVAKKKGLLGQY